MLFRSSASAVKEILRRSADWLDEHPTPAKWFEDNGAKSIRSGRTPRPQPTPLPVAWSLPGLGQLDEATNRTAVVHTDAAVRRNATRALGRDDKAVALFFASAVVSDTDALTKLAAFVKLAEFSTSPQIKTVVTSLVRKPANQKNERPREATPVRGKVHGVPPPPEGPNLRPHTAAASACICATPSSPASATVAADSNRASMRPAFKNRDASPPDQLHAPRPHAFADR